MSVRELIEELTAALGQEAERQDRVREAMVAMRDAFASVRPDRIEQGMPTLASVGQQAAEVTECRERVCAQLAEQLGIRGEMTMTKLLPHVPADLVRRLSAAAEKARAAAHRTRVESRVGERLLELSGRLHRQLLTGVEEPDGATIYDAKARPRQTAARRGTVVEGVL
jgi:hypothetical protein